MSVNVLAEIVANKKQELAQRKLAKPLANFKNEITPSSRSLQQALSNQHSDFILECKKASPSKGLIRADFNLEEIVNQYKDYASAISVLADEKYFQGKLDYVKKVSQLVELPVLCKDFFVDTYQVYEARLYGADAILLMLSVLNDEEYTQLAATAKELNLDVLTEVHSEAELARAIKLKAKIVGINNRNLIDLSTDLAVTERLSSKLSEDTIVISESGINTHDDIKRLAPLVNGFLIGSSIMAQPDIRFHCKSLLFGHVKVCGLTTPEDALNVDKFGGNFAGLMFYPQSPRAVTLQEAKVIVNSAPLNYVGVFVDALQDEVISIAENLQLYAVQLHGDESDEYIEELRQNLNNKGLQQIQIWKAKPVTSNLSLSSNNNIEKYLLDTFSPDKKGGTGKSFDWSVLKNFDCKKVILAGGITPDNALLAQSQNCYAIDLSSGVESSPGKKSHEKIAELFRQLRV